MPVDLDQIKDDFDAVLAELEHFRRLHPSAEEKRALVGKSYPRADGTDLGFHIVSYDTVDDDFLGYFFRLSTLEPLHEEPVDIDATKALARYLFDVPSDAAPNS
jgi:hypothetical protein